MGAPLQEVPLTSGPLVARLEVGSPVRRLCKTRNGEAAPGMDFPIPLLLPPNLASTWAGLGGRQTRGVSLAPPSEPSPESPVPVASAAMLPEGPRGGKMLIAAQVKVQSRLGVGWAWGQPGR